MVPVFVNGGAMRRLTCALVIASWWLSAAYAQAWPEVCLPGSDNGGALSLRIDAQSDLHLMRIGLVSGDLLYSKRTYDGELTNERVARRISRLAGDRVTQTDLRINDGIPHGCFRDVRTGALKYASRLNGEWSTEVIAQEEGLGNGCGLFWVEGVLHVAYQAGAGLKVAAELGMAAG